ncbi:aspartyl protease family protein [Acidisarcina polymorpha]|nr:aspartyl protease family protein [Acidisarcina polymorpha]
MRLLLTIISSLLLFASPNLHAQHSSSEIPLQPLSGGFLTVRASIAGHEGTFLFDSGSGVSNITPQFASKIGCKPWGLISGAQMTGQRLDMQRCDNLVVRLGAFQSEPGTVGVFDLAKVLPPSMSGIDGTIALDVLASCTVRFSYVHHTLQILDPGSVAKSIELSRSMPIHMVRDAEGMALTVNLPVHTTDGIAWFELDSGNTSPWVLVGRHLASNFELDPTVKTPQRISLSLTNGSSFVGSARLMDLILDGNLGTSFLMQYDVTVDLVHARAWVHPIAQ